MSLMEQSLPEDIGHALKLLAAIPYENLSKAVNVHMFHEAEQSLMLSPGALLEKHRKDGAGGTCFSLTWFLMNHLKQKGYSVYPVMCDRPYGKNTHCCAILEFGGQKYLLDPGYLAFRPILLSENDRTGAETVYNTIDIVPDTKTTFRLSTLYQKEHKFRFTLKDTPVGEEEFFRHWQASFKWESLTYPVVTMLKEDAHLYFQKEHLYVRKKSGSERIWVPKEKQPETLEKLFGIHERVTRQALEAFGV